MTKANEYRVVTRFATLAAAAAGGLALIGPSADAHAQSYSARVLYTFQDPYLNAGWPTGVVRDGAGNL